MGSTPSLTIDYKIENVGETAYSPKIRITLPDINVGFAKVPPNCELKKAALNSNVMDCNLNSGNVMFTNDETSLGINIDTTKLNEHTLIIKTEVSSASDEGNYKDNTLEDKIPLVAFSEIEISG